MITGYRTTFVTHGNRARVMFTFDMRRKPLYYIVNLIIPCCLLSCIVTITFILPPHCYMRLTLSTYILHVRRCTVIPFRMLLFTGRQQFSIACYAAMQSPVLSTIGFSVRRLSVCRLSVRPLHAGAESKRRKLGSRNLHGRIAQDSIFRDKKFIQKFERVLPDRGR